jgi:hypothetical protein
MQPISFVNKAYGTMLSGMDFYLFRILTGACWLHYITVHGAKMCQINLEEIKLKLIKKESLSSLCSIKVCWERMFSEVF